MPVVLEGAVPPPHLHLTTKSSWPSPYSQLKFPVPPTSSPVPMSPESLHSYIPHLHENLPNQDLGGLPTSGWFGASVPAADASNDTGYGPFTYDQPYVTPHTSSITFSPPTQFTKASEASITATRDPSVAAYSPVSEYSRVSDGAPGEPVRPSDESYADAPRTSTEHGAHLQVDTNPPNRPRSSPSTFTPTQQTSGPEFPWTMNPLGISTPAMHEQYYSGATYPPHRSCPSRLSEPAMDLPAELASPQPRRMYAPIAPHPLGQRIGMSKRSRDDDECSEQSKRRKRSDTNATVTMELGEEDRLLIRLKDEESMPWKDIAARFQSDLGKTYQIPALQMRLKRLRERMRVWTEADVRALRMAHEYWVQNKFDIISQKMLEYGAAEKWTPRQCARKWAEIDPGPTPYTTYDHHSTPTYAPYTMSPVEAPPYMPYLHIP
ncbi:hypothetical protein EJ04DRAFT_460874 [Polyplosphaeria fusca]|uniref:Myb-like domain-containing protein n=1 Tax=Polyplosphaeria fusca TaxID=682080 RepID=A0A9P4R6S6_9PLEO|nr:hypothetical protein EJ04DRAFT_460874 [Polyplosphaeria fusca]